MANREAIDYIQSARRRLDNAANLYQQARRQPYDDGFLELADVAMLVWSAGIDVLSGLMRLDGYTKLGTSRERHHYLRDDLHEHYPELDLRLAWPRLATLHNFQHNLDLPEPLFVTACNRSGRLFDELNQLLPAALRLPNDAYAWLLHVE